MRKKSHSFTMAEILIALTIIGVLAAIILPSVMVNVNERIWDTKRKALFTRLNQALEMLPSINTYGFSTDIEATNESSALAFITNGLGKVMNMDMVCENDKLYDCGVPENVTTMYGQKVLFPKDLREFNPAFTDDTYSGSYHYMNPQAEYNTKAASFLTLQGEGVAVFYNPLCKPNNGEKDNEESLTYGTETTNSANIEVPRWHFGTPKMCVNLIYDLNGKKGPNLAGKDIGFITVLYSTDSVIVGPVPMAERANDNKTVTQAQALAACRAENKKVRVPTLDELTAVFYNRKLFSLDSGAHGEGSDKFLWSSTIGSNDPTTGKKRGWYIGFNTGRRFLVERSNKRYVRCVKR